MPIPDDVPSEFDNSEGLDNPVETTPGDIFAEYLRVLGEASAVGDGEPWPAYSEVLPDSEDSPANLIVCSSTSPKSEGTIMETGRTVQKMGVQVRLVADSNPTSYRKSATIRQAVSRAAPIIHVEIEDQVYEVHRASLASGPLRMPETATKRFGHTLNYTVALLAITR